MRRLILFATCLGCYAPPPAPAATEAVEEITLHRTISGLGYGAHYTVTLRSDGTASYHGLANVPMFGDYQARVDQEAFRRLVEHAIRIGFWTLEDKYRGRASDQPSTTTTLVASGRRKEVFNYGLAAPNEVREFENAIEDVARRLAWRAVSDRD